MVTANDLAFDVLVKSLLINERETGIEPATLSLGS